MSNVLSHQDAFLPDRTVEEVVNREFNPQLWRRIYSLNC